MLWPRSTELGRQVRRRLAKNLDDGPAIGCGQPRRRRRGVGARKNRRHAAENGLTNLRRQGPERRRVDHVAARIPEQPTLEVELPKRPAAAVAWTLGREHLRESGRP